MLRANDLLGLFMAAAFAIAGCVETVGEDVDSERESLAEQELDDAVVFAFEEAAPRQHAVEVEASDLSLCRAQANRQRRCSSDVATSFDIDSCANRYACSRRLWRTDVQEAMYACLSEWPCGDDDPVMGCFEQVAADIEPSAEERKFERQLNVTEQRCGELIEVAPSQSDAVYSVLNDCISAQDDSCDAALVCMQVGLEDLVADICGSVDTI